MEIQNSLIEDIDFILDLYKSATAYQKERFISHWPEFDREMVVNEIDKNYWGKIILTYLNYFLCLNFKTFIPIISPT